MKNMTKRLLLVSSLVVLAGAASAQDHAAPAPTIQQRKKTQQKRVVHGVQKGKLTRGEASSLEKNEAGLNAEERDMREDNRGRLTAANRAKLRHQQDHMSKAIYHDKHNATIANASAKSTTGHRTSNQQHAAGLKTSQLTSGKAAHLQTKETLLHREIHSDREDTGKREPLDQQNKTSNQIHLKKHNARMF